MSDEPSLREKVASSEVTPQVKDLLVDLVDEVEILSPLLPTGQRRRVSSLTESLVSEVLDPSHEPYLWEVALDIIAKAAQSRGERGLHATELVTQLSPVLHAYFEPPGEVTLQEITEKTVFGVILLSETLTEPKINFVAPNAISLAQALFSKHAWYRAIYAGKSLVGFLMLYDNPEEPTYFLWRFMIAEPFHGRGYGRKAIQCLIDHARSRPGATELQLSCGEGQGSPEDFYAKIGFTRTGKVVGDEVVMRIGL
jgi:diamine N-acetyltransferase